MGEGNSSTGNSSTKPNVSMRSLRSRITSPATTARSLIKKTFPATYHFEAPKIPIIKFSTAFELENETNVISRPGDDFRHTHPQLPGRDYSEQQRIFAIGLVIEAEQMAADSEAPIPDTVTPQKEVLLRNMLANPDFKKAAIKSDRSTELRIAFEELDLNLHFIELSRSKSGLSTSQLRTLARTDIDMANDMLLYLKADPDSKDSKGGAASVPPLNFMYIGLPIFENALKKDNSKTAPFTLALQLLPDLRWIESRIPQILDESARAQALTDYSNARGVLDIYEYRLQNPVAGDLTKDGFVERRMDKLKHLQKLDAALKVSSELEVLNNHISELMSKPLELLEELAIPVAVEDLEAAIETLDEYHGAVEAGSISSSLTSSKVKRLAQLVELHGSKYTELQLALDVIDEMRAAYKAISTERPPPISKSAPVRASSPPKARLDFSFPFPHVADSDAEFESLLPSPDVRNSQLIKRVARTLKTYSLSNIPYKDVPDVYKKSVASLRHDYSHAGTVRMAKTLVSISNGMGMISDVYPEFPTPVERVEYDVLLATMKSTNPSFITNHFEDELPSSETLENALILLKNGPALFRNHVMGGWGNGTLPEEICGYYDPDTKLIIAFDDPDLSEEITQHAIYFEFFVDPNTSRVHLVTGWETPSIAYLDGMQVDEISDPSEEPTSDLFEEPSVDPLADLHFEPPVEAREVLPVQPVPELSRDEETTEPESELQQWMGSERTGKDSKPGTPLEAVLGEAGAPEPHPTEVDWPEGIEVEIGTSDFDEPEAAPSEPPIRPEDFPWAWRYASDEAPTAPPIAKPEEDISAELVFDLPNVGINDELEAALNQSFPRKIGGVENPRNVNIRRVARTLILYLGLNSEYPRSAEQVEMVLTARSGSPVDRTIPPVYAKAVESLKENPDLSNLIPLAVGLVNASEEASGQKSTAMLPDQAPQSVQARPALVPQPAQPPLVTEPISSVFDQPPVEDNQTIFQRLQHHQKILIAKALYQTDCTVDDLEKFRTMDPGVRELRMQNYVASVWPQGDFKANLASFKEAKESLYQMFSLQLPSSSEKMRAIANPANLSSVQRDMVASLFGIQASEVTEKHITGFGIWTSGEPAELLSYWEQTLLDDFNIISLSQSMVTSKASPYHRLSSENLMLLSFILNKSPSQMTPQDFVNIEAVTAFRKKLKYNAYFWRDASEYSILNAFAYKWFTSTPDQRQKQWMNGSVNLFSVSDFAHRLRFVKPLTYAEADAKILEAIYEKPIAEIPRDNIDAFGSAILNKTYGGKAKEYYPQLLRLFKIAGDPKMLREVVSKNEEFNILLEFLGGPKLAVQAEFVKIAGLTAPKFKIGSVAGDNGEPRSVVTDNYCETNDDCFTGVQITLPSGQVIHMNGVFDGMGGHDTMKGLVPGYMSNGQVASNVAKETVELCASAGWIQTPEEARRAIVIADLAVVFEQIAKKRDPDSTYQENDMGTTATITLRIGNQFYGVHAGDSEYKVIRDGEVVLQCPIHNMGYMMKSLGQESNGKFPTNVIVSALGTLSSFIDINGFKLQNGDKIFVSSDGISDLMLDVEIVSILGQYPNLDDAGHAMLRLAESRKQKGRYTSSIPPDPSNGSASEQIKGHNDDKTVVLDEYFVEDGSTTSVLESISEN
ncbi:MAG: hypothetical protein ABH983_06190 [Candidatus Micrarchaeota archaeon]